MGLCGMSLQGGTSDRVVMAKDGKLYQVNETVHAVYARGSKQLHDDVMRGLEAQIQFLAANVKGKIHIRLRSDKCNNFCTHAMIAFIVDRNKQNWRREPDCSDSAEVRVISWTFSEAQTGKDQLDVNFSYVSRSFKFFVSGGTDLLTGKDMFDALKKHPIAGTSALLVDVRGSSLPVFDKCPLGIQKSHYFEFNVDDVVVRHHNGIDNIGVWKCPNQKVLTWIKGGPAARKPSKDVRPYVTTPAVVIDSYPNLKPVRASAKTKQGLGKRKRVRCGRNTFLY